MNTRNHAAMSPGRTRGRMMSRKLCSQLAPEICAASSSDRSICSSEAQTVRTEKARYLTM
ncbi:MAG: hypothetical protein A4E67_00010 [Syntrophaceae bacterium PtaB.Bin038]|nr:MAG: hypothetical protein A4E67_00010 [Syntrophaceae bacterium PtaB.Bin038]